MGSNDNVAHCGLFYVSRVHRTHNNYHTIRLWLHDYHIMGNFWGRKLLRSIYRKGAFHGENFLRILNWLHRWVYMACLMEKTFVGGCKITKFVKVFSLESFLLYGLIDTMWRHNMHDHPMPPAGFKQLNVKHSS